MNKHIAMELRYKIVCDIKRGEDRAGKEEHGVKRYKLTSACHSTLLAKAKRGWGKFKSEGLWGK